VKKIVLAALIIGGAVLVHAPAYAEGKYYLEIGKEVSQEQAEKSWHALSAKYKSLLKGLWYYPKTSYENNMIKGTRIQAGPVDSKVSAQKICNKLFAADISCFVIEDMERAPPKTVASLADKVEEKTRSIRIVTDAPVVIASREQIPADAKPKDDDSMWSWVPSISGDDDDKPKEVERKPEPAPTKNSKDKDEGSMWSWVPSISGDDEQEKERPQDVVVQATESAPVSIESRDIEGSSDGQVQVAEAIRVPLSQNENKFRDDVAPARTVMLGSASAPRNEAGLPAAQLLSSNPVVTTPEVQKMRSGSNDGSGWLNISAFTDEGQAGAIWQRVRSKAPAETAGLRVRILRPLVTNKFAETSLNVGPFATNEDAMNFCSKSVKAVDSGLNCRFNHGEGLFTAAPTPAPSAYEARREMLSNSGGSASTMKMRHAPATQYWAEVLSSSNQMDILNAWEDLRTAHSDLFANKRSNVSRGGKNGSGYVVRVGPLASNQEASSLCSDLQSRDVSCTIVTSSR
jgi:hypothetical protein